MIRIIKLVIFVLVALAVTAIGYNAIVHKIDSFKTTGMTASTITAKVRQRQLDCLARNIYYEAGVEAFEGKVAVAQVTLNRSNNEDFPSDICKVVYQKNIVYERVLCQFSWYCNSDVLRRPLNAPVYDESMEVAKKVLLEGFRLPSLEHALYFHGDYINPGWKRERITKIGQHIFYK